MPEAQFIYPLHGAVQPYAWGGFHFIPGLLGRAKSSEPAAEYWLGAHPAKPATVEAHGVLKKLDALIAENPAAILGESVTAKYAQLPYLLKVLDVRNMLSIQVHPAKEAAQKGFAQEDAAGVPPDAPHRNYKDRNHKPELMVALSDFWLLHGFKPEAKLHELLYSMPDFAPLAARFSAEGYEGLYQFAMTMPQADVNALLQPLAKRLVPLYHNNELLKRREDFWAARAFTSSSKSGNIDRGIFSIYFFNLVHLKEGEGIYQPAGLPHAYLEGQNVEIMAASDNVLRAGLTDKHIDIGELMKHVRFEPTVPYILRPSQTVETVYNSAAEEFELSKIELAAGEAFSFQTTSAETLLVLSGEARVATEGAAQTLVRGSAVFIGAGTPVCVSAAAATQLFRAVVPQR